jgi:class 3 adenylate cyclase
LLKAYQSRVAETIIRFDGFIARYMGDGVLAYFGWPRAGEADAEQAVRAALAIVETVSAAPIKGEALRVRIGIATGLTIVGERIGVGEAAEYTVVGETPNRAARLQSLTGPGGIVIDSATRSLVGYLFEVSPLAAVSLKGLPGPVQAFEVASVHGGGGDSERRAMWRCGRRGWPSALSAKVELRDFNHGRERDR